MTRRDDERQPRDVLDATDSRRRFLVFLGAASASAAFARAQSSEATSRPEEPIANRIVRIAWERAVSLGKPLMVIVVPDDAAQGPSPANVFGTLLNHGTDEILGVLALAELVCAPRAALKTALGVEAGSNDGFVLVEMRDGRSEATARGNLVDARVPTRSFLNPRWDPRIEEARAANVLGEQWIAALASSDDRVAELARRARERLPALGNAAAQPWKSDQFAPSELVDRAALVHAEMVAQPGQRAVALARLAEGARARWVRNAPPGSHWAESHGCAIHVEGIPDDEQFGFLCGMAEVSELSARFLWFYENPAELLRRAARGESEERREAK